MCRGENGAAADASVAGRSEAAYGKNVNEERESNEKKDEDIEDNEIDRNW